MAEISLRKRLYPEFARIGSALASDKRLELIDLLAQGARNVDALAAETAMPLASVSQHLQVLRNARLVEAERKGNKVVYRLADPLVLRLWLTLRWVGQRRLAEVAQIEAGYRRDSSAGLTHDELAMLLAEDKALLIDVRPRLEYESGHLPGAISMPVDELPARLGELPRDRRIVTYCRGIYCAMSDDAEALLRGRGFEVVRLEGGWPEWWDEGRPVDEASV
jgi:rhodanese-related sulfurtransferase